jgi:hemolysin activation/secretion protein
MDKHRIIIAALTWFLIKDLWAQQPAFSSFSGKNPESSATASAYDPAPIRRQIENERERKLQESTQGVNKNRFLEQFESERLSQNIDETRFGIRDWDIRGAKLVSMAQLESIVDPYRGLTISLAELDRIARRIEALYRDQSLLARVVIPAQDVSAGTVRIEIVEARLGEVTVEGFDDGSLAKAIRNLIVSHHSLNEPLDLSRLERALSVVNELPGVGVIASLSPGLAHQETNLIVRNLASDPQRYDLELSIDNFGARSTGRARKSLLWAWNRPFFWGDQLQVQAMHSPGTEFVRMGYSVPVSRLGTKLTVFASRLNYQVHQTEFAALQPEGESQSTGLELRQALWRLAHLRVDASASIEKKSFEQRALGLDANRRELMSRQIGIEGRFTDDWVTQAIGASLRPSLSTFHIVWIQTALSQMIASSETRLMRWSFARVQPLWAQSGFRPDTRFLIHYQGQHSPERLDSAEAFYLGGASGVRAYPSSEGGGTNGRLINAEIRFQWDPSFSLGLMRDLGVVYENDSPAYRYQGYGVQMSWQCLPRTQARITLARRDKANPLANPLTGADRDGTRNALQIWASINRAFQ